MISHSGVMRRRNADFSIVHVVVRGLLKRCTSIRNGHDFGKTGYVVMTRVLTLLSQLKIEIF